MARSKATLGKRSLIAIGLIAFVAIAFIVVWRRSLGVSNAREIARMERRKQELLTERKTLQNEIREASSYGRVVSEARRRLDMRVPEDFEVHTYRRDGQAPPDSSGNE